MKQDLPLHSLEIKGYRGIRHLQLPTLEQVNLFVGVNNVGKTSLLEAIQLYASRTPVLALASILREHSGYRPAVRNVRSDDVTQERVTAAVDAARSLFYGSFSKMPGEPIRIGPVGNGAAPLTISLPWSTSSWLDEYGNPTAELFLDPESPLIGIERGENSSVLKLDWFVRRFGLILTGTPQSTLFVPAEGLKANQFARYWDQAVAAGQAEAVEEALRSVVPELERIHLLGESAAGGRSINLKLRGTTRPVPIVSMGDGTRRTFGFAVSMAQVAGGVVLIDEVENGLHYSVQPDVWRAVLQLAERLDIQVFATTHSSDAIEAFSVAAGEAAGVEGRMHRLENRDGDIRLVEFDEEDLAIVTRQRIEVR
jgi:hypothetical protein